MFADGEVAVASAIDSDNRNSAVFSRTDAVNLAVTYAALKGRLRHTGAPLTQQAEHGTAVADRIPAEDLDIGAFR